MPTFLLNITEREKEAWDKFKGIADKENKKYGPLIKEILKKYAEDHAEGNPSFTIDQFADPAFKAMPAFMSEYIKWHAYFMNQCTVSEMEELREP